MTRRIYLSARFARRLELRACREALRAFGHNVVSTWLDAPEETPDLDQSVVCAQDCGEIEACDLFVAFTEPESIYYGGTAQMLSAARGGRHSEFGYALALQATAGDVDGREMDVIIVGEKEHVLHHAAPVKQFSTWAEALAWIGGTR